MLKFSRFLPTLIPRAYASQNAPPTPGSGVPISGSTKTSSDAPPLDHEHVDIQNKKKSSSSSSTTSQSSSSSSSGPKPPQSFLNTPFGKFATIVLLTVGIYASFQMIGGGSVPQRKGLQQNEHYRRATADYQAANTQGTDVKK